MEPAAYHANIEKELLVRQERAVDTVRGVHLETALRLVEEVTLVPVRDADPVLIVDGTAAVPALDDDVATA